MFNKIIDNFKSKEVEIKPQMYVGKLKKTFEETFGFPIRVYNGKKFAADDVTLASIRKNEIKGSSNSKIKMSMKVIEVEDLFLKDLGVIVQICNKDGSLADNNMTLGDLSRMLDQEKKDV